MYDFTRYVRLTLLAITGAIYWGEYAHLDMHRGFTSALGYAFIIQLPGYKDPISNNLAYNYSLIY